MYNYRVTRFVSEFGFAAGIVLAVLIIAAGFLSQGIIGGLVAVAVCAVGIVPFLMFCEGMHALVTIANNTRKPESQNEFQKGA